MRLSFQQQARIWFGPVQLTWDRSTKTTDNAPHFSNTTNLGQNEPASALGTSSLRPDAAHNRPGAQGEEMSTASIKSGIIGAPQGNSESALENKHPTQSTLGGSQALGGGTTSGSRGEPGIDGPIDDGKGRFGAPESSRLMRDESYGATHTPDMQESTTTSGTDRAFPLAGGVTHSQPTEKTFTSEREPGTKEKVAGVHDGQGRESLAGAAAAATSSSAHPHTRDEGTAGNYHPEALAAATAAAARANPSSTHGSEHAPESERHIAFRGSPEATTNQSDRAAPLSNVSDNRETRMHIPGEFPSPTPVNQSSAPSYFQSKETPTSSGDQHELRHTGTLDHPQTRSTDEPGKSEHHYGRDAAIAGGLGAAGAGAYAAGKHGQQEPTQTSDNIFPTERSPYSSKQVDPRVDNKPAPSYDQQKFDPTTSSKHQGRDAVLTGGSLPTSSQAQPPTTHSTTQSTHAPTEPTAKSTAQPTEEKSQHHYGRDAALAGAGAGAATTAGLYANQRANEPDSGPAKSTIGPHQTDIANILDPRVQPDPALQKHHHAAPTADDPAPSTVGPHKSDAANILDPRVLPDPQKQKAHPKEEHHYGRDAAVAGGTGAAGYGAYEAAKSYDEHPATQPTTALENQRYDPTATSTRDSTLGTAQRTHDPASGSSQRTHDQDQKPEHHYGRDAAVAGGLGAAGAGAYAATRGHDSNPQTSTAEQHNNPIPATHQLAVAQQHYNSTPASQQTPVSQQQHPAQASQQPQDSQHHYGRDAAVVGGLGAAGAGAYAATRGGDHTQQPAAQQNAPYQPTQQSAVGQQQYPSGQTSGQTSQNPQTTAATEQPQHHYGRDAAAVGGLGAAGAGAYAATRGDDRTQQPVAQQHASSQPTQQSAVGQQQYPPTTSAADKPEHHYGRDAAVVGGLGAAGAGAYAASRGDDRTQQPVTHQPTQQSAVGQQQYPPTTAATEKPQHHYGRDAAAVGGLGAAGAGTYAATRGDDRTQQPASSQQQHPTQSSSQPPLSSVDQQQQRHDPTQDPNNQHQKRDAAALGAAGVAAGAGGAYAYSQHDAEKERKAAEKAQEQQLKEQQKEFEKKQKAEEKAQHKADEKAAHDQKKSEEKAAHDKKKADEKAAHDKQKELEHQQAKEQKQHDKLVVAEEHKRQKELEREQREREKEAEKAHPEEEGEKKKHGLFGFLHRDKEKRRSVDENDRRASGESPRHSKEYAGAGAAAAGLGGAAAYEGLHESDSDKRTRNKLHKEPPPGHPAREAMEHQQHDDQQRSPITGKREHIGTDGPIGNKDRISHGDQ